VSSVCWENNEKKRKKGKIKREAARGFFPRARAGHAMLCQAKFSQLLGAIRDLRLSL
jgi:hypothetical protein